MEYLSKTYRLDEEVIAWLEGLREAHGSVNKGLRKHVDGLVLGPRPFHAVNGALEPTQQRGIRSKGDTKR